MSEIKKCPICNQKPEINTRWNGSFPMWSWYECEGTPPCTTGTNHSVSEENYKEKMVRGWNKAVNRRKK